MRFTNVTLLACWLFKCVLRCSYLPSSFRGPVKSFSPERVVQKYASATRGGYRISVSVTIDSVHGTDGREVYPKCILRKASLRLQ
jgi:hypothetical protein